VPLLRDAERRPRGPLRARRARQDPRGTWTLFSATFVATGEFDRNLSVLARKAKDAREKGDYEAAPPSAQEAAEFVAGAADFIAAVEKTLNVSEGPET